MKMTVIVTYRRGKKSKQMQFARIVEICDAPERGDFITFTRVDGPNVVHQSSVLAKLHDANETFQRPQRFRVSERELFSTEQSVFGEAVIYVKPGKRALQMLGEYVDDNSGTSEEDARTPEEAVSNWMAMHGLVPLPCLKEIGKDKRWKSTTPLARDHYEIAREYLGAPVSV